MAVAEPTFCNLSSSIGRCTPESGRLLICISHVLGLWKRRSACEARSSSQSLDSKERTSPFSYLQLCEKREVWSDAQMLGEQTTDELRCGGKDVQR